MACVITFPVLILLPLLVMVVRSLRVKTGRGPTCPKCRFNLYKLDTDHCPECGYPIAEKGVLPPHRINHMSICLELLGVSFLVTALSLLVDEAFNSRAYFKNPRSGEWIPMFAVILFWFIYPVYAWWRYATWYRRQLKPWSSFRTGGEDPALALSASMAETLAESSTDEDSD